MQTTDIMEAITHAEQMAERFKQPFALIDLGADVIEVLPFADDKVYSHNTIEIVRCPDEPD